jgi:hypothetical protein
MRHDQCRGLRSSPARIAANSRDAQRDAVGMDGKRDCAPNKACRAAMPGKHTAGPAARSCRISDKLGGYRITL